MSDEQSTESLCAVGGADDGTLRVCCSAHGKTLCGRHYARSHFVEVGTEWDAAPCDAQPDRSESA